MWEGSGGSINMEGRAGKNWRAILAPIKARVFFLAPLHLRAHPRCLLVGSSF